MVRLHVRGLWWVLATSSLVAAARQHNGTDSVGSEVYILECDQGQVPALASAIKQRGGTIRHEYDSSIFRGISFQMPNATGNGDIRAELTKTGLVKNTWSSGPATGRERAGNAEQPGAQQDDAQQVEKRIPRALDGVAEASKPGNGESNWAHAMMNVDKLHAEGFLGDGVKIAVVDTGVNYTHPALGGCFGKGCRVAKGANLIKKDGDPMDFIGHGTMVASALAGYDAETGFMGVAPKATIHAYLVAGSKQPEEQHQPYEDRLMAGWLQAFNDGPHVITSSTGLEGSWAGGPLALVISRIVASGIPCIVAFGNQRLPFQSNAASWGSGVVAVGSVSADLGARRYDGVYRVDNGNETAFEFWAGSPGAWVGGFGEGFEVHDLDADYGDGANRTDPDSSHVDEQAADDCRLSPGEVDGHGNKTLDLAGHVVLIHDPPSSNCSLSQRMLNARDRGARHVLVWDDNRGILSDGPNGAPERIVAIGKIGTPVGAALADALAAGKRVTMRRHGRLTAGAMAWDSTYGPTYELDVKPNVLAPGHLVSVAVAKGGYGWASGTSFAAPLVAGVYALVGQARGTFNAALLNSLIMGTAEPQARDPRYEWAGLLTSVARQGSGLIRAWEAAHATTVLTPTSLAFNDSANRVASLGLRIDNQGNTTVQYQLSHVEASTMYALYERRRHASPETFQAPAQVQLSKNQLTLDPGEAATIDVSASDPEGLEAERLPVWSGWIAIQASDGTRQTVPYLGLAGSLREAAVWSSPRGNFSYVDHAIVMMQHARRGPGQEPPGVLTDMDWSAGFDGAMHIEANLALALGASPEIHVYAVPLSICPDCGINGTAPVLLNLTRTCVPKASVTEVGGTQTIGQIANSPYYHVQGEVFRPTWDGALSSGLYAPPGKYKLIARALSIMGDRNNQSHWQAAELPEFTLAYVDNKEMRFG